MSRSIPEDMLKNISRWGLNAFFVRSFKRLEPLLSDCYPKLPPRILINTRVVISVAVKASKDGFLTPANVPDEILKHSEWLIDNIINNADNPNAAKNIFKPLRYICETLKTLAKQNDPSRKDAQSHIDAIFKSIEFIAKVMKMDKKLISEGVERDIDTLINEFKKQNWNANTPVSLSIFGPMWNDGKPKDWPEKSLIFDGQEDASSQIDITQVIDERFEELLSEKAGEIQKISEVIQVKTEVFDGLIKKSRELYEKRSLSAHAESFKDQKESYIKLSRYWLAATAVMTIITIIMVKILFIENIGEKVNNIQPGGENIAAITILISRVIIVSLLSYVILFCARNFRSNNHMAMIADHRYLAIQTFEAFAQEVQDPQIKDAVLLAATRCVFDHVATGMIGKEDKMPQTQILEIVRKASTGDTSG